MLDLQKAPALEPVFDASITAAARSTATVSWTSALDKPVAALPRVEMPEKSDFAGKEKDLMLHFGVAEVHKAAADLQQKPPNKSAEELLAHQLSSQ